MAVIVEGGGTKSTGIIVDQGELLEEPAKDRSQLTSLISLTGLGPGNVLALGEDGLKRLGGAIAEKVPEKLKDQPVYFTAAGVEGESTATFARNNLMQGGLPEVSVLGDLDLLIEALNRDGIALIAGTGQNCGGALSEKTGQHERTSQYGGIGPVLGDEGSGYWLGKRAVNAVLLSLQGHGEETSLGKRVFHYLAERCAEILDLENEETREVQKILRAGPDRSSDDRARRSFDVLLRVLYQEPSPERRDLLAPLAEFVIEDGKGGDLVSEQLILQAVANLLRGVEAVTHQLEPPKSFTLGLRGGLFDSDFFREQFRTRLERSPIMRHYKPDIRRLHEPNEDQPLTEGMIDVHLAALRNRLRRDLGR
ncbi:hypothetical protein MRY87_11595 [bacterium]|nr:hypothetical protein [bacterium]